MFIQTTAYHRESKHVKGTCINNCATRTPPDKESSVDPELCMQDHNQIHDLVNPDFYASEIGCQLKNCYTSETMSRLVNVTHYTDTVI